MVLYPIVPSIFGDWFDYRWVMICYTPMVLLSNGVFPVLLTYDWFLLRLEKIKGNVIAPSEVGDLDTKGNVFALSQGMDVFQAVLNNTVLLEAFTQFTMTEWCVENVLFYKEVDDFRAKWKLNLKTGAEVAV